MSDVRGLSGIASHSEHVTELIVRELRLRAFEGLTQAMPRRQDIRADDVVAIPGVTPASDGGRLAAQYSRRRPQPGDLAL